MDIEEILTQIEQANDMELSEIIKAVIRRYGTVHPDWEVMFLSLPKGNPEERRKSTKEIIDFLRSLP